MVKHVSRFSQINSPSFKLPGGFLNLISLSDGHAMPVFKTGTIPFLFEKRVSESLKSELAIAPQGTIDLSLYPLSNG